MPTELSPPSNPVVILTTNTLFPYPATETQHPLPRLFERITQGVEKKPGRTMEEGIYNTICDGMAPALEEVLDRFGTPRWLWELIDFKDFL